jgi:DNA-binding CsgD family transcriptional regulator
MRVSLDSLPGIWCAVDANSHYIYYNQAYAELVGVADQPKDFLIGKTVADMPCNAAKCAPLFWKADELVKSTKKMVRVLHTIQMADDLWKIIQIDKQPVFNANGELESIIFHLIDQSANHVLDLALSLSKEHRSSKTKIDNNLLINSSKQHAKIDLKPKESECLFYLSRGFAYKEIAQIQDVSYRTIVDHIERLKSKFNATTTTELVSRALAAGYPGSVPQKYFHEQISIILSSESLS